MKVYEHINQLKGTNVSLKQMADWGYMNKVCPITFMEGLELGASYPAKFCVIASAICASHESDCEYSCLTEFLSTEINKGVVSQ